MIEIGNSIDERNDGVHNILEASIFAISSMM